MAEVLSFPLTPVPLALSHVDGTMLKTDKSALLKHLESKVDDTSPQSIQATVIDASFFLFLHCNLPSTFGGIARVLLSKLVAEDGDIIHYVVDKWIRPSIKDGERDNRNATDVSYQILGADQKRPTNWRDALKSSSFKIALNQFLIRSWADDSLAEILSNKVIYANCGDVCYKYSVNGGEILRVQEPRLFSTHEEADSRMFHHVSFSARENSNNLIERNPVVDDVDNEVESFDVVVRSNDTDCLVIGLGCFKELNKVNPNLQLWMEVGTTSNNTRRYISVNGLYVTLGEQLSSALPGFHAFTGCDYLAAFSRKGKVRPFKLLETDTNAQTAFSNLGEESFQVSDEDIKILEKFVCKMYGKKIQFRQRCTSSDIC